MTEIALPLSIRDGGDMLAENRLLPPTEDGNLIALLNAGACGYSMSSNHNSRPKMAEALVDKSEDFLILGREGIEDIPVRQRIRGRLLR